MNKGRLSKKWSELVAAALITWLLPNSAHAASCSFTNIIAVNFGTYQVFDTSPLDSTGSITLYCTGVQPMDLVTIEIGPGSSGTYSNRHMLNGTVELDYNLYLDASRTVIWGNGSNGTTALGPTTVADQTPTTWTVYGRIPALQNVSAGSYTDTVLVTVQF